LKRQAKKIDFGGGETKLAEKVETAPANPQEKSSPPIQAQNPEKSSAGSAGSL